MRKIIIFGIMLLFLVAIVIGDSSQMNVAVGNVGPNVLSVDIFPDEKDDAGFQVNKTGVDRTVTVNATIEDWNSISTISSVMANISGPSVIGESPLTLTKIQDISSVQAVYSGDFILGNLDDVGSYGITVNASDGLGVSWTSVSVDYQEIPSTEIDVNFYDPAENQEMPSMEYYLQASTTNEDIVKANFSIDDVYYEGLTPLCDEAGTFEEMCVNDTAGTDFGCLADFTQNYLTGIDTFVCLRAMFEDSEGNNGTDFVIIELDNMVPNAISDLDVSPSSTNGYIDLSWTAPSENGLGSGTVSGYIIKISTSPITNEAEFNAASFVSGACSIESPSSPGSTQSCTQTDDDLPGYVENSSTVYYYAIKSYDDFNQNSSISNTDGSVAPYHQVEVDSVQCFNVKNNFICNDTTVQNTNYLYDILNVSGNITNAGNVVENANAELQVIAGSVVDNQLVNLDPSEIELVTDLEWIASLTGDQGLRLKVGSKNKDHKWFKVWSIADYVNLDWYDANLYPAPTETSGTNFYVTFDIDNTNSQAHYYDIPVRVEINTTFSVNSVGGSSVYTCDGDSKKCYLDVLLSGNKYHYFEINGLSAGTYNVSVIAGNSGDTVSLYRKVVVEDPAAPPKEYNEDAFNFNDFELLSYGGRQDADKNNYEIMDDGYTLNIWGNNWKAIPYPVTIYSDSVLSFYFKSTNEEGEVAGVGVDTNLKLSSSYIFKVYGTQRYGIRDYDNYVGSDWQYYEIPIGNYFTGNFNYITFANDADKGQLSDVYFREITIT